MIVYYLHSFKNSEKFIFVCFQFYEQIISNFLQNVSISAVFVKWISKRRVVKYRKQLILYRNFRALLHCVFSIKGHETNRPVLKIEDRKWTWQIRLLRFICIVYSLNHSILKNCYSSDLEEELFQLIWNTIESSRSLIVVDIIKTIDTNKRNGTIKKYYSLTLLNFPNMNHNYRTKQNLSTC